MPTMDSSKWPLKGSPVATPVASPDKARASKSPAASPGKEPASGSPAASPGNERASESPTPQSGNLLPAEYWTDAPLVRLYPGQEWAGSFLTDQEGL
ncbi:hypothetical protein IMZ48_20870 [Candidatus Bathyarchaeota archaeon]|nr:hypothetical protein [Candidatus Bathyarchaeota archaeon]